jgi:glycosyltransferase involved in cell wall biosynthesis
MTPPLVSILIPAFNAARWIGETVRSALAQTWPRTEIVVVDDGSTDDTAAVVDTFGRQVRLVRQPHRGASAAQNEALRHAAGEFIQRLDADDVLGPDKIALQMARLTGSAGSVAVGEWARFYVRPDDATFAAVGRGHESDPAGWLVRECAGGGPMLQPGLWLVPRQITDAVGPWDERLSLNNDFEYFVRVLLASREVRFTAGARLYYRSGNPTSLASLRSPDAWRSQLLSLELGTAAIARRRADAPARRACADLFQQLAFDAYLEDDEVYRTAQARADAYGGSSIRLGGGAMLHALSRSFGWRRAKRVKTAAYRLGYRRVAAPSPHKTSSEATA